jgi:hypothetical protein
LASNGGNRKLLRRQSQREAYRRSKRNKHFKSGGTRKVAERKKKRQPKQRKLLLALAEARRVVGREAKVGAESEAVEEEVMGRWVGAVEGVKRRHQVQRNDRSVYILYILCRRFKRGKAQHMIASRRFYQ